MNILTIDNSIKLVIGGAVLAALFWFFKWAIQRSLDEQFNKMKIENAEGKKEREYDIYLTLRGHQVTNECLHELIYAVLNGEHNGGLQKANEDLESYRVLVDKNMAEKAARWTNKINK